MSRLASFRCRVLISASSPVTRVAAQTVRSASTCLSQTEREEEKCVRIKIKKTRSVFANDKFVKLKQDVTRQRERFEK